MRKSFKYTYQQMNQDVSKSKHPNSFYWEGKNIRIITNEEFGSVTNQKGNELVLTLPDVTASDVSTLTKDISGLAFPATGMKIIHTEKVDEKVILFTTNENVDCIWLLEDPTTFNISSLIYIDDLGFNYKTQIESVGLSESDEAQKVYWVDGENEIRFINIINDNLDKTPEQLSVIPPATLLDPYITGYGTGGTHKAGVIQYAYNLYNKYGAQTRISGSSELVYLHNDDKGNPLGADVSKSPIVQIDDIPTDFEYIRIYSIFYSSLDVLPRIALIYENENSSDALEIVDNNNVIKEVSLDEYNLISTTRIIPKHITTKDGRLFFADYKTDKFDVEYDARAFAFNRTYVANPTADYKVTLKHADAKYNDIKLFETTAGTPVPSGYIDFNDVYGPTPTTIIPSDHDCIIEDEDALYHAQNPSVNTTSILGGKGLNVSYQIFDNAISLQDPISSTLQTSLKKGEKYRIGVVFYNDKGEESFVKWMADIKIPGAGQEGYTEINSNPNFADGVRILVHLDNIPEEAVAYRLVRVERKEQDQTVKGQGALNGSLYRFKDRNNTTVSYDLDLVSADYLQRTFRETDDNPNVDLLTQYGTDNTIRGDKFQKPTRGNSTGSGLTFSELSSNVNGEVYRDINTTKGAVNKSKIHFNVYSPDITFNQTKLSISPDYSVNCIGFEKNINTFSKVDFYTAYDLISEEEAPIDVRKTYSFTATNTVGYLFQVDELPDVGGDEDKYVDNFFDITTPANGFVNLISPKRFIFQSIETTPEDRNRWEFKKVFYKREFEGTEINEDVSYIGTIDEDTTVIFTPPILNSVAITTKKGDPENATTVANTIVDATSVYSLVTEIEGETLFSSYGGASVFFTSSDLFSTVNSYFNNDLTNSQKTDGVSGDDYDFIPLVEFTNKNIIQYGGNTYAARQRNVYIPFSNKQKVGTVLPPLTTPDLIVGLYGDTFIQKTALLRMFDNNQAVGDIEGAITEVIEFVCESSINSDMRYDTLKDEIGKQTLDENTAYGYNSVYQQQSNLTKSISKPFNFTEQATFRSEIIATPPKLLGELIDNWSEISINDRMPLDTKYGAITGFGKLNDNLFAFQRNAIAFISINPRVQLSASDNIPILLGTGDLLERYEYTTTKSGTLHPKSIVSTKTGLFYFDILNYSINRLTNRDEEVSTVKGLFNYIKDYTQVNYDALLNDVEAGSLDAFNNVVAHYDNKNEDIYFTLKTNLGGSFTVAYNILADGFTSFYDFIPSIYFNMNNNMFTCDFSNTIWEHDKGLYNYFYDTYYPSSIKILFNAEPDDDKIIDNVGFVNDTYSITEASDKPMITFNEIKCDTAYQTTGVVPLIIGSNIRRKFREFNIIIPREAGTRNRIRAPYSFIELVFDQSDQDYKFVLYDTRVDYTIN